MPPRYLTILSSRLSKSVWPSAQILTWVPLPLARADALFKPHLCTIFPRQPGRKLPATVFSNSNTENWIEYYFLHEALTPKKKKSITSIWLIFLSPKPHFLIESQDSKFMNSVILNIQMKTLVHDDLNTVHPCGAHRLLNTFTYIFSFDAQRLGSSQGLYYYLHFT